MEELQKLGLADWNVLHIDDDDLAGKVGKCPGGE